MKLPISGDAKSFAILVGVGVAGVVVLTWFFKKTVGDTAKGAADLVGGIVSGNNAVTEGTRFEGTGIFGTLGAAADSASGGVLSEIGGFLGRSIYDVFHKSALDPNQRKFTSSSGPTQAVDKPGALRF